MLERAIDLHRKGQLAEAFSLCREALVQNPGHAEALHLSGLIEAQRNEPSPAIDFIDRAIAIDANNATFHFSRGSVLRTLGRLEEAVLSYDHALGITPDDTGILASRGNALLAMKRFNEALASYDRALAITPTSVETLSNRGVVLQELKRCDEALQSYDRALALNPHNAEVYYNRADVLHELKRFDDSLTSYDRAIAINPVYGEAFTNRGIILQELKRFDEALQNYDRALAVEPDQDFLLGLRLFCRLSICDWHGLTRDFEQLDAKVQALEKAAPPFAALAMPLSAAAQRLCAETYIRTKYPQSPLLPPIEHTYEHKRIRLGYFSSDFRNHPVGALIADLIKRHDRAKFEVIGFYHGPPTHDATRTRLEKCFDRFIEIGDLPDRDAALLARSLEVDIAIDLNGFTTGNRAGIFALRAAPVQVNYLGYPGTMGAPYIDYLIADETLIPKDQQQHYSEKVVYLPDSFQVNDSKRRIAEKQFTRAECGLTEGGFVFCCFNNSYKISPGVFDVWMRLLKKVGDSVLWLSQSNESAMHNLRAEARARGIDPARLIFAPFLPNPEEHLARLSLADLFLDTLPYNAHATASDALWAGVPVLTCLGETLPGRVAASALNAIGLRELVTHSLGRYEELALELATKPGMLPLLRQKLAANRLTQPLFDTARFTKHVESAFSAMWQQCRSGRAPRNIRVRSQPVREAELASAAKLDEAIRFHRAGDLSNAASLYREITAENPSNADALHLLGVIEAQRKQPLPAIDLIDQAIAIDPKNALFLSNRGNVLRGLQRFDEALASYDQALTIKPDYSDALRGRGSVLEALRRFDDALASYNAALAITADDAEALMGRGNALQATKRFDEAVRSYDRALEGNPDYAEAFYNRGNALQNLMRYEEALASYDRALAIKPDYAEAWNNHGTALRELRRLDEALVSYEHALAMKPDYTEVLNNRGNLLRQQRRFDDALASYDRALAIDPDNAVALNNRGILLQELGRFDQALSSFERALAIDPGEPLLLGSRHFCKMRMCDWHGLAADFDQLLHKIELGETASGPFETVAAPFSAGAQKTCAETYIREKCPENRLLPPFDGRYEHGRIRLGYFSSDFRNHPVASSIVELIERHDRAKFEVIGFSLAPPVPDFEKVRSEKAFDRFVEVGHLPDNEVASLARRLEIDVAIDLNGFTKGARTGIFALRAAPVQVNYLGYPGTMGAPYIDYLIADSTLIPPDQQIFYSEKIAYLPDSFQVNDSKRPIATKHSTRTECGLPEEGFVFCCFNNSYKINPNIFDVWMRLLRKVEDSVLWLSHSNAPAMHNLRSAARARGVDPARLIFAPFLPGSEHLARLRLADLFLDTLPCNAGATASDALWAGVPVLTCLGATFAGRIAASLLKAIGLPELIAPDLDRYEALALELATNPRQLLVLRQQLAANRLTWPLFDTARFTKNIESAFLTMWQHSQKGSQPEHFYVQPAAGSGLMNQEHPSATESDDAAALISRGNTLLRSNRFAEALANYDRVLAIQPASVEALNNRAVALQELKRGDEALKSYNRALAIQPNNAELHYNRGDVLRELNRLDDALASYDQAATLVPTHVEALNNRALILQELKRFDEALASYERAIAVKPDYVEALYNRGNALMALNRFDEALESYDRALAINPEQAGALHSRGILLQKLKRFDEALVSYDRALAIKPDEPFLFGLKLFCQLNVFDWRGLPGDFERLATKIQRGEKASPPFAALPAPLSAQVQRVCAETYARAMHPKLSLLPPLETRYQHDRIRLGYFSSDFHNHPVASLIAELFECHDRAKFEVIGFSLGPPARDAMNARLEKAFDRFVEVGAVPDRDVALLARRLEVDIAIDLNGFTAGNRTNIFALGAAPVQVSYLGYPGTMGAPYIDYLIADATLIPPDQQKHYAEKIVCLPDSFQVNDSKRRISEKQFSRAECGLPETGFVFCCFNNGYKISSDVFNVWMRLLKNVVGSVLWLPKGGDLAVGNLKRAAEARGVDPARLVFAPFLPNSEHLARLRLADLFLDTLPCNAGATASDALWTGLPVLTCLGETFAGRIAASLLKAIGLPELIAENLDHYEALGTALATDPKRLLSLKEKLAANRLTYPLFDTRRFARHVEGAFLAMWQRHQKGLNAEHIYVRSGSTPPVKPSLKLDLGAGQMSPPGFTPLGHGHGSEIFPLSTIGSDTVDEVRASHCLEHFPHKQVPDVLKEWVRVLKPGGLLKIAVPDFEKIAKNYLNGGAQPTQSYIMGGQIDADDFHKSLFDEGRLRALLAAVGIVEIERWTSELSDYAAYPISLNLCGRKPTGKSQREKAEDTEALKERGHTLLKAHDFEAALANFNRALAVNPDDHRALDGRAIALRELNRLDEAIATYDRTLSLDPKDVGALNNRALLLGDLKRFDDAFASYDRALAIQPDNIAVLNNRGLMLLQHKRFEEALETYNRALAIVPDKDFLFGLRLSCKMNLCDWHGLAEDFERLAAKIEAGEAATPPFVALAAPLPSALQRRCAEIYIKEKEPERFLLPPFKIRKKHDRIRLGYFSSDFRNHAVGYLTAELFERHDRRKFEVIGFSLGPPAKDAMRARLEKAFDRFIDVDALPDKGVAQLARQLEIDIAIDLNGLTTGSRTSIFAFKAAPIQVNYLGYPGTMGAPYIDYLIADATLMPTDQQEHYSEKLVFLPDTYQINDSKRPIAERQFTRGECGLPEDGFIFCCFNNNYKIAPNVFDAWMRLLTRVPGSVLWLSQGNKGSIRNLRAEAQARDVDPERLVFATYLRDPAEHLARFRLADLFLDTLPYNAHATASDALWAGVPVLTCIGKTFPGRVAASALNAIGLPELITQNHDDYEALALELAANPDKLRALRRKLAANRLTLPLFDTARFTRHIESAFSTMWQQYQKGLAPEHIDVQSDTSGFGSGTSEVPTMP